MNPDNFLCHLFLFRANCRQVFFHLFIFLRIGHLHHPGIFLKQKVSPLFISQADVLHITFQNFILIHHPLAHPHLEKSIRVLLARCPPPVLYTFWNISHSACTISNIICSFAVTSPILFPPFLFYFASGTKRGSPFLFYSDSGIKRFPRFSSISIRASKGEPVSLLFQFRHQRVFPFIYICHWDAKNMPIPSTPLHQCSRLPAQRESPLPQLTPLSRPAPKIHRFGYPVFPSPIR